VSVGQKRKPYFYDMPMFALGSTILLVRMWAGNKMRNTDLGKERVEFFILSSLVGLNGHNFSVKESLNHILKLFEFFKKFRFKTQQIYPSELAKIVDETHIVLVSTNRCSTPNIRENKFKRIC
jgi:hypothetical protein